MMRLSISLLLVLSLSCASDKGAKKEDLNNPPAWLPVTLVCLGCLAVPLGAFAAMAYLKPNQKVTGWGARMEKSPYSGDDVGKLLNILVENWDAKFHNADKVRPLIDRMDITWVPGTPNANGVPVVDDPYGRGKVAGFFDALGVDPVINRGRMRVTWSDDFPLWQSALAHEFVHGFLLITKGDAGDAHLSDPNGVWTLDVQDVVNQTARRMSQESGGGLKVVAPLENEDIDKPL